MNSSNVDKWTLPDRWEKMLFEVGDHPWMPSGALSPGGQITTHVTHMWDYPREGWFDVPYGYSGSERARFVFQQVYDYNEIDDDDSVYWRYAWIMKPLNDKPEFPGRHCYADWFGAAFYNAPFWLWAECGPGSLKIERTWSEQLWVGERIGKVYKTVPVAGRELW